MARYYWTHTRCYKKAFFAVFVLYTIGVFLDAVLSPYLYKIVIDGISSYVSQNGSLSPDIDSAFGALIMHYVLLMILLVVAVRVLFTAADYTMSYFQSKVLRDLENFAFKKTINHSYQFFVNSFAGGLVKKAGRFVHSFEEIHDISVYGVWLPVTRLVSVFAVLFIVAPVLGTMFFVWTIIFIIFSLHMAKKRVKLDLVEASADSRMTGRLADVFANILNLKMFSSKSREEKEFFVATDEQKDARDNAWKFQNFTYLLQGSIVSWLQIMALYVSVVLWFDGQITLGTIALAYSYSATVFDSVWNLGKQMSKLSKAFSNASEMVEIIDTPIEITDPKKLEKSNIKNGDVFFDHVSFSYKQGHNIFEDFSLQIESGEKVGIVGTSGAGKTTITKLLLRFADVTGGAIKIDGQDIRNIKQDDLRDAIAYVPQDPILFHRSLSENISYGKPNATKKEIEKAAKLAHAHEFIERLSHGYDTLVGERGVKLSGGERQRVAIARAILKNSPILILDEATSSLDSVSETHIKDALDTLMQGRTTIVIAHRLSTIEKMDRIIVMEQGKIVEEGDHATLLAKEGVYHNFWNHQQGGFIK